MSDTDSFINEVTEEVRRDQLYRYLRRYGWIAVVVVVGLVGGAAWNEYNKAQETSRAQQTGDALLAALGENDPAARAAEIAGVDAEGASVAVTALISASMQLDAGDSAAAFETLQGLASNNDVPDIYNALAAFKAAMLDADKDRRATTLAGLAQPGAPFSLLAQEQLALHELEAGNTDAAIIQLTAIFQDAGVTPGMRVRAQSLLVALGAELPPGTIQE